jgi:hypothetical protein
MDIKFNTEKKARAFVAQIDRILLSDFPHAASESALNLFRRFFEEQLARISRAGTSSDRALLESTCTTTNQRIYQYLPILGLLLRSTNTRNSFEAYYAFVEIARALIGPGANVIFSSEWDFSPLTYPMTVSVLPDYVLLGMPSSESSNALILPLAGHELGHSVWSNEQLENKFAASVQDEAREHLKTNWPTFVLAFPEHSNIQPTDDELTNNMFLNFVISNVIQIALSQIEEIFCDGVGAHLFGQSYALAFHYLLAPSLGGGRSTEYPTMQNRANFIATLGGADLTKHGFADFKSEFSDPILTMPPRETFISDTADAIGIKLASAMYSEAHSIVMSKAKDFAAEPGAQPRILNRFVKGLPVREPRSLSDIVNAGWAYFQSEAPTFQENERELVEWISELVLKSIEVLEFRSRTKNA